MGTLLDGLRAQTPQPQEQPRRTNLPAPMIDLIRDGIPDGDNLQIRTALLRTASSAMQRGWDRVEWITLLEEPESKLGIQYRETYHKRQLVKQSKFILQLHKLWDQSERWVKRRPPAYNPKQVDTHLRRVRHAAMTTAMNPTDRTILITAINIATANNTTRPALPKRLIMDSTGLKERSVRNGLARLERAGWLEKTDPGRAAKPPAGHSGSGRAALYRIHIPAVTTTAEAKP